MTAETLIRLLVGVAGPRCRAVLIAPQETLVVVDHTQDKLPQVGRKIPVLWVMLAAVLRPKDRVCWPVFGLGGVGFIDAFIYWGERAPHAVVGLVCVIAAMVLLRSRKGMSRCRRLHPEQPESLHTRQSGVGRRADQEVSEGAGAIIPCCGVRKNRKAG